MVEHGSLHDSLPCQYLLYVRTLLLLALQSLSRGSVTDGEGGGSTSPASAAAVAQTAASAPRDAAEETDVCVPSGGDADAAAAAAPGAEESFQTRRLSVAVDVSEQEALTGMIAQTDAASAAEANPGLGS